jgi:tetratricopeptide (TPR) repeat protein
MKTERRHELQENALADWLGKQVDLLKPYSTAIVAGVLITAVLIFALSQMGQNRAKRVNLSWDEYFEAAAIQDVEALREIGARYARTEAGAWARQSAGDISLATGSQNMFIDRAEAKTYLEKALDDFLVANKSASTDLLKQRSLLGMAQAYEALNRFDEAESAYERVISGWPSSSLAKTSQQRLTFLKKPSTQEFYQWFMEQTPTVPKISMDGDAAAGMTPPSSGLGGPEITPPESSVATPDSNAEETPPASDDTTGDSAAGDDASGDTP